MSEMLSGLSIKNAQIFLVYEIRRFFVIFQKVFRKHKLKSNSRFEIPNLVVGFCKDTLSNSNLQNSRANTTAEMLLLSEM